MSETTFSSVSERVIYSLSNAPMRSYPYPHFYAEDVFPEGFFAEIRRNLLSDQTFSPIEQTGRFKTMSDQKDRYVIPLIEDQMDAIPDDKRPVWDMVAELLQGEKFGHAMLRKFQSLLQQRFGDEVGSQSFSPDVLLIRDHSKYWLGPHSDAPWRVLVVIFYLASDDQNPELGTSVYVPKEPNFKCEGGLHYAFKDFENVYTAPYKPNSAFGFFKTSNSFHGVEPFPDANRHRDLIHYFIRN